jgi:predicted amidohydrolase
MVREASAAGAIYVQTPEMTGALVRDKDARETAFAARGTRPDRGGRGRLARELGIFLHVGSTAIALPTARSPTAPSLRSDGGFVATYDKIHMFDVDLDNGESWRESAAYEPGEAVVADLPFAKLGFAICYDLRFPQLFRAEALAGARGADRAGRLHAPDRRGALARAAARPRHRERRLGHRGRAGRRA